MKTFAYDADPQLIISQLRPEVTLMPVDHVGTTISEVCGNFRPVGHRHIGNVSIQNPTLDILNSNETACFNLFPDSRHACDNKILFRNTQSCLPDVVTWSLIIVKYFAQIL